MWIESEQAAAKPAVTGPPRYLVLVPVGTLFRPVYDGESEAAAKEAYLYAAAHNQIPLFVERRRVVMV